LYRVLIFGTGSGSLTVRNVLNERVVIIKSFVDNNKSLIGTSIDGIAVISPEQIVNDYDFIIIASQYYKEIRSQLLSLNVDIQKIISFFEPVSMQQYASFTNIFTTPIFSVNKLFKLFAKNISSYNSETVFEFIEGVEWNKVSRTFDTEGYLLINHIYGGGTQVYQDYLINCLKQEDKRIYTLNILFNYFVILDCALNKALIVHASVLNQDLFNRILRFHSIDMIYINQLISFPQQLMMDFIKNSSTDFTFFIHDFFCICPSYNLLNNEFRYCGAETNADSCQKCISRGLVSEEVINISYADIDIGLWRQQFKAFLESAKYVVSPSESTRAIVNKYYPGLTIEVREHELGINLPYTYQRQNRALSELTVAFIGNVSKVKGNDILYELYEQIVSEKLPITIKVIGTTEIHKGPFVSEDNILTVHGKYKRDEVADLLKKYNADLVIIPAIWPETFNYTTSEVMAAGYPIITFNLGAPAERVLRYRCGWVVPEISAKAIGITLKELLQNTDQIAKKADSLDRLVHNGMLKRG